MYNRFFEIFDLDGSSVLSLSFVLSVWNFLTYDEKTMAKFFPYVRGETLCVLRTTR